VQEALANEDMLYVGKYNAPDYETIIDENCGLAIESTMIYHSPEIKEKLEEMGIPVMVEHSSYESHPLGRMEWIKLYGILCDKEEEADAFFEEQMANLNEILTGDQTGKKVAFFYISSAGYVNVRKPGDYISKMIEMAGGTYALADMKVEEDNALSTLNMQMEDFFANVQDADILIYNSTIEGGIDTLDQLYAKNKLFKEFKAAKEGQVWCTESNVYQETTGAAKMISELYTIIHDENASDEGLEFLHRVK
jgi:iron complex transport system substrate-binding protein